MLIQTYTPEHPSIALAGRHDFLAFAKQEMAFRRQHAYPPFERLARLIVRSQKLEAARDFADHLASGFRQALSHHGDRRPGGPAVKLLGPAECAVFRLNNYFRFHFQLQCASAGALHEVLREVLATARVPGNVEYQVDIDPHNML